MGLELVGQGHNLVISTGTASGKSLVFQAPTLHHLATHPNGTAIAIYPIKALARDQVIRWRNMAEAAGLDPAAINRIDGDVRDLTERRQILQRTRLALMTPDVIQQWLMAYSEPLYHRRPQRHDLREVQNTQYNIRHFVSNLAFLILDEAHTYDGALGTHCLYLLHRLQQKRKELMAQFEPLRIIAASADRRQLVLPVATTIFAGRDGQSSRPPGSSCAGHRFCRYTVRANSIDTRVGSLNCHYVQHRSRRNRACHSVCAILSPTPGSGGIPDLRVDGSQVRRSLMSCGPL